LRDLHDRIDATTVYVTHDQLEAMAMADRIAVMNKGRVEQVGTPQEIYDRPASMFVADFIGSPPMNFLAFNGAAQPGDRHIALGAAVVEVPELKEGAAGAALALGVRPEHVMLDDAAALRGTVFGTEYLGTTQIVTISTEYGPVKARIPATVSARSGETVGLKFRSAGLVLFDGLTQRALATAALNHGGWVG
jgi:multiple sugar transport system ATP-binding protein